MEFALKLPVMKDRNLFSKMGEFREFTLFELGTKEKIMDIQSCIVYRYMHCAPTSVG